MKIMKLNPKATIPTRGTAGSAGLDLYACAADEPDCCVTVQPGETKLVPTGIAAEIPEGYVGLVFPRSGLATKQGLRLANCVAVIDSDYRGELKVPIFNDSKVSHDIDHAMRFAQLVIMPYAAVDVEESDHLSSTDRGVGGFGSTGV